MLEKKKKKERHFSYRRQKLRVRAEAYTVWRRIEFDKRVSRRHLTVRRCPCGTRWGRRPGWPCRTSKRWGWRATSCPSRCAAPPSPRWSRCLRADKHERHTITSDVNLRWRPGRSVWSDDSNTFKIGANFKKFNCNNQKGGGKKSLYWLEKKGKSFYFTSFICLYLFIYLLFLISTGIISFCLLFPPKMLHFRFFFPQKEF